MDKNHVYTAEEIHKCIDGYILQNSIWDEFKLATVINYRGYNNIDVQFTDDSILEHVSLDTWRHHRLTRPS